MNSLACNSRAYVPGKLCVIHYHTGEGSICGSRAGHLESIPGDV
jgi:hypothetical protein